MVWLCQPVSERPAPRGQVLHPPAYLRGLLPRRQGELGAPGAACGRRFGRPQRRVVLAGVAAAQFGVGGDSQLPLLPGCGLPFGAVGHDRGEHGLALPVGLLQGVIAAGPLLVPYGVPAVAA